MRPVRRAWRAASRPGAFFAELGDRPRLGEAAAAAALSALVGLLVAGLLIARATRSDGVAPILAAVAGAGLAGLAAAAFLGGLVLVRPAGLDLRAWEIALWAWVPSGFLALSLLPIGLLAPGPALAVGAALLPAWHLWLVARGTAAHAAAGARGATLLYAALVLALPLAATAFTAVVFSALA